MKITVNPAYLPDPAESPREAIARQRVWAALVREEPLPPIRRTTIAAVDVHLGADRAIAVAALVTFPDLTPIAVVSADAPLAYPYVPGLLSWRELPAAVAALEQLPDSAGCADRGRSRAVAPPPLRARLPPRPRRGPADARLREVHPRRAV